MVPDFENDKFLHLGDENGILLPISMVKKYTRQIAAGLSYLHVSRIIHCDIKP
jgi:serine/threonine protein kinase